MDIKLNKLTTSLFLFFGFSCKALSCVDVENQQHTLMQKLPVLADKTTDIALVTVNKVISPAYADVTVLIPIKGFLEVNQFLIYNGDSSCDVPISVDYIGKKFYVAGQIFSRNNTKPIFIGSWNNAGQLSTHYYSGYPLYRILLFAPF